MTTDPLHTPADQDPRDPDDPLSKPLPEGKNRTFLMVMAVIVLVVVGGLLVVLGVVLPNMNLAALDAKRQIDVHNLRALVERYQSGQTRGLARPKSDGFRFWVALFAGDGPGDDHYEPPNTGALYADPSDASLLICPMDSAVQDVATLRNRLADALRLSRGAHMADPTWCSYAGPKSPGEAFSRPSPTTIVGATGARNGVGFFPDGLAVVYADGKAEFVFYQAAASRWGWAEGLREPNWQSPALQHVRNVE